MIFRLDERLLFPEPALAEEDGLLAVGGDLSVERLLLAYQNGIFPWYGDDSPILWYSPHERFVLYPPK
jgi:leucyl/phenylalanyl-tRNA--protein transferase